MNLTRHLRAGLWALALALCPAVALAASTPVFQSGTMTAGNLAKFFSNGLIGDAAGTGILGDGNGNGINPFAVNDKGGLGLGLNSGNTGSSYSALQFGHDSLGNAVVTWGRVGTGAAASLYFPPIGTAATSALFWLDPTGNANALTQAGADNSTKVASTAFVKAAVVAAANVRTRLTSQLILNVATGGTDSGSCVISACATLNYAWQQLVSTYDLNGRSDTIIQVAPGTYTQDFHPAGNPIGNSAYTTVTIQGNIASQNSAVFNVAAGFIFEGGSAPGAPAMVIQGLKFVGNGTGSTVTTTQWSSITFNSNTWGCNPNQRIINPSVGSRVYWGSGNVDDKSACTATTNSTTVATNPVVTVASNTGISLGMNVSDFGSGTYLPNTTVTNISGNNITVSPAPVGSLGAHSTQFSTPHLNFFQQDPGSVLNITATGMTETVPPCYLEGWIGNNAALTFVLNNMTFNSNQGIGPPFVVIGGGQIYAPSLAGLNYFPGQVKTMTATFAKATSVLTLAAGDKTWLNNYAPLDSLQQSILISGSAGIFPGTVITDNNQSVGNTVPIYPYTSSAQTATLTIGGQQATGGLYLTNQSLTVQPIQAMPYFGPFAWTPTDGSGAALAFTNVDANYQQVGEYIEINGSLTYPATADGTAAKLASLPITVPNLARARTQTYVKGGPANLCAYPQINTTTVTLATCTTDVAVTNATLSGATIGFNFRYPAY